MREKRPLKCPEEVFEPIMNNDIFTQQENIFASNEDVQMQKLVRKGEGMKMNH